MRLRITRATFPVWFGSIWGCLGLVLLAVGVGLSVHQHLKHTRLIREGVFASGLILVKSADFGSRTTISTSSMSSRPSNTVPTYRIRFRFTTLSGVRVDGDAQITASAWYGLSERGPIRVRYLPDQPDVYEVDGQASAWLFEVVCTALGLVFAATGGLVIVAGLRAMRAVASRRARARHPGLRQSSDAGEGR